jgi:hypothetical protein
MNSEPRIRLEPLGEVGVWVYIDGKLMDLFHYSDLQRMSGIEQETIDAIERIYDDLRSEEE